MTLTGTYIRSLDEKHRLAVPKRLREQFGEKELTGVYIAPGMDQSLAVYSRKGFEALASRLTEKSSNRPDFRNYLRMFYARAEEVPVDSQGRMLIPERLVEFAQLKRDVMLLGVHDHAEIWDKELWDGFLSQHNTDFDEMADRAFE